MCCFLSHYRLFFFVLPIFPSTYGEHQNIKKTVISTTIFCLFVILLVFIVPFFASVKEKTEIKNMKTKLLSHCTKLLSQNYPTALKYSNTVLNYSHTALKYSHTAPPNYSQTALKYSQTVLNYLLPNCTKIFPHTVLKYSHTAPNYYCSKLPKTHPRTWLDCVVWCSVLPINVLRSKAI